MRKSEQVAIMRAGVIDEDGVLLCRKGIPELFKSSQDALRAHPDKGNTIVLVTLTYHT